jgi:HK97 family phage major capsid protein
VNTSKELRKQIAKLLVDQQALVLGGLNSTNREAFDKRQKDIDQLEADVQRVEALETRAAAHEDREADKRSFTPSPRTSGVGTPEMGADEKRSKINSAFRSYALSGFNGMRREERDLLTTADGTGGALIPQLFDGALYSALKFYGPTASLVKQRKTGNGGNPLKLSIANDTANGLTLLATEGTSGPAETDPLFQSKLLGVDTVTGGLVKVSFQELEDSYFDLGTWLEEAFGKRYARGLESAVTLGKDSAGTMLPNVAALTSQAVVAETTSTLAAGIGWTDLTAAFGALDPAYLADPKWLMSSNTRSYLIGLRDGFGRPYFTPDPSGDKPFQKLMGYDIVLNQSMPSMGANAVPIIFGSLQDAYLLRTEGQPFLLRLSERYADTLEVLS